MISKKQKEKAQEIRSNFAQAKEKMGRLPHVKIGKDELLARTALAKNIPVPLGVLKKIKTKLEDDKEYLEANIKKVSTDRFAILSKSRVKFDLKEHDEISQYLERIDSLIEEKKSKKSFLNLGVSIVSKNLEKELEDYKKEYGFEDNNKETEEQLEEFISKVSVDNSIQEIEKHGEKENQNITSISLNYATKEDISKLELVNQKILKKLTEIEENQVDEQKTDPIKLIEKEPITIFKTEKIIQEKKDESSWFMKVIGNLLGSIPGLKNMLEFGKMLSTPILTGLSMFLPALSGGLSTLGPFILPALVGAGLGKLIGDYLVKNKESVKNKIGFDRLETSEDNISVVKEAAKLTKGKIIEGKSLNKFEELLEDQNAVNFSTMPKSLGFKSFIRKRQLIKHLSIEQVDTLLKNYNWVPSDEKYLKDRIKEIKKIEESGISEDEYKNKLQEKRNKDSVTNIYNKEVINESIINLEKIKETIINNYNANKISKEIYNKQINSIDNSIKIQKEKLERKEIEDVSSVSSTNSVSSLSLKNRIKSFEGLSLKPYRDADGYSVGYGHFIKPNEKYLMSGVTKEKANELFEDDFVKHLSEAKTFPNYNNLETPVQEAIVDMTYNMGKWWNKWPKTTKMIVSGDYISAAESILKSKYARQVGNRAKFNANLIAKGYEVAETSKNPNVNVKKIASNEKNNEPVIPESNKDIKENIAMQTSKDLAKSTKEYDFKVAQVNNTSTGTSASVFSNINNVINQTNNERALNAFDKKYIMA